MSACPKRSVVFVLFLAIAPAADAEASWELPAGVEAGAVTPALMPTGTVGAITFTEDDFPYDTVVDGLAA